MTHSRNCARVLAASTLLQVLTVERPVSAWDSQREARMPSMPQEYWSVAFPNWTGNQRFFYTQFLKDSIGGMSTAYGDETTKLLRCPVDAIRPGEIILAACRVASANDLALSRPEWLSTRVAGELENWSEHTLIAREAARRAGLLGDASVEQSINIFEPFWIRYPARNAYVATAIPLDEKGTPPPASEASLLMGQSQRPVDLNISGASFVARRISLLELAQVPDFSNSLSDWAMGNEACPIEGTETAYAKMSPIEACHNFPAAMGAINITHFNPMNRDMWRHYHGLALTKMAECNSYQSIRNQFYNGSPSSGVIPDTQTEVHDCERLAMAYELFGLHFMQDAWSSGHMWAPWGYPRFNDFPDQVILEPGDVPPEMSLAMAPSRKALVAAAAGIVRGSVHGSKSLAVKLGQRWLPDDIADQLERWRFFDDPLNAGVYHLVTDADDDGHDVNWIDPKIQSISFAHPAAGDLFWDPLVVTQSVVRTEPRLEVQRERMLNCTGKSMLEVYLAGPRVHGQPTGNPDALEGIVTDSDECWGQWATNDSMLAAIGPVDPLYIDRAPLMLKSVLQLVNYLVINEATTSFINYPPEFSDELGVFKNRLREKLRRDLDVISNLYWDNADSWPNSTGSARQLHAIDVSPTSNLRLLGVPTARATDAPGPPRDVDYVDVRRSFDDTSEGALALSRIFWRGDLRRTCALTNLDAIRNRCVASMQYGGDPEACTACVAVAELHVPVCVPNQEQLGDSKCSAALAETGGSGVPGWWSNTNARFHPAARPYPFDQNPNVECGSTMKMALEWCTETPPDPYFTNTGEQLSWRRHTASPTDTDACGLESWGYLFSWGTSDWRGARFLVETPPKSQAWIYPMAVGFDYTLTTHPGDDRCDSVDEVTSSRDFITASNISPLPLSEYLSRFGAGAEVPRCGVTQRATYWNRDCLEARDQLFTIPDDLTYFNATTGTWIQDIAVGGVLKQCAIHEPRTLRQCPAGFQCTAGGECIAGSGSGVPAMIYLQAPPP